MFDGAPFMPENPPSQLNSHRDGILRSPAAPSHAEGSHPEPASSCVPFRVAVVAAGIDLEGRSFVCESYTEMVAPFGCSIVLRQPLAVDDELDIRIDNREVRGRVAGKIRSVKARHVYAIEFEDSAPIAWDESFPKRSDPECVLPLRCSACDLVGDVTLSGVAVLVFKADGAITRTCPRCCERTKWRRERGANRQLPKTKGSLPAPRFSSEAERVEYAVLPLASHIGRVKQQPPSAEQRTSSRVHLKRMRACVQCNGRADEVLIVNMSRGGLRFVSCNRYTRGDWLRVAAPYIAGGNNIFVGAEIVRVQKHAGDGTAGEYALAFRSSY
jgi:hypothetical protein